MAITTTTPFVPMTESPREETLIIPVRVTSTGREYPKGTTVLVEFGHVGSQIGCDTWKMRLTFPGGERVLTRRCSLVYTVPEVDELSDDGISQSILGDNVEPDGFDSEGSPSWLVALGLI